MKFRRRRKKERKRKKEEKTPGTRGWSRLCDRTLAVKSKEKPEIKKGHIFFFFGIYLLVMPKYCGKQILSFWISPKVGQKQKTEERRKRDRKLVITMVSYAVQRPPWVVYIKPPGPKKFSLGSFLELGQKQKTEKKERRKKD